MKLSVWICCGLLLIITTSASAQKNLISNGSFEDELFDWNGADKAKITPWDKTAGKNSYAIIVPNTTNWIGLDQIIRVPKGSSGFEFSAWLKTVNVVRGDNEWMGAIFSAEFLDKADKKIGEATSIARITGDTNWEQAKKAVKVPVGAVKCRILLAMGYASGTMLIDDVKVTVISEEEAAKL